MQKGTQNGWKVDPLADLELVSRVQSGCAEAFGTIYEEYYPYVYRYMRRKVKNAALAEDLTQDVFIRALESISQFDPRRKGTSFSRWLRTISFSIFVNDFRRRQLERKSVVIALEGYGSELSKANAPSMAASESEMRKVVQQAIGELPELMGKYVACHYTLGMSYGEICRIFLLSENSLTHNLYRARRLLGEKLKKYL